MQEALDEAADRMRDAGDDLGRGRPMEAEGSQGVASRRLEDAQQSLRQAMQQASEQAQGGSQSSEGQEGRGEEGDSEGADRGGQGNERDIELDIPTREEFRTPEEYRRALLEGMEGEVPEEYRSMKRRYYEELVHQ